MKITKEVKTGLVVVATLLSFYGLYNFLKGKDLFSSGNIYYVKYDNVSGLLPSKPVTVNGLRVGRVEEIKIVEGSIPIHFVAKIKLDRPLDFSINTLAEINEGLMSDSEIRLLLEYSGTKAKNGDTLKGTIKGSVMDVITKEFEPTKSKLDSLMVSFNSTVESLDKLLDEENRNTLKQVLKDLDLTLVAFAETSRAITETSKNANQLILNNNEQLKNTLIATQQSIEKFGTLADKITNLELEKIINEFGQTSEKLNTLLDDINSGKGTLGAIINDKTLYEELMHTTKSLDELLNDLKENPNRYVNFSIFGKK
ncbi:MAG: MlaD family protein [Weeksellaceae bacterium]|jgi:phospholipid/cholesterol/gamma-HCH transport system substrate-binding protein|nr:MlaD family protein [Weeksellaceae bacterium]MDX9704784.1 MlaD family protein [Weeksellaceae bacterium]